MKDYTTKYEFMREAGLQEFASYQFMMEVDNRIDPKTLNVHDVGSHIRNLLFDPESIYPWKIIFVMIGKDFLLQDVAAFNRNRDAQGPVKNSTNERLQILCAP